MTEVDYSKHRGPSNFFKHTESRDGDVRLKILSAEIKLGKDMGGYAAKGGNEEMEYFVYKVMRTDRREQTWDVKSGTQVATECANKNLQPGDVIRIHYLGQIMPTEHGMKAKYEIIKEKGAPVQVEPSENENLAQDVQDTFGEDVNLENIK